MIFLFGFLVGVFLQYESSENLVFLSHSFTHKIIRMKFSGETEVLSV